MKRQPFEHLISAIDPDSIAEEMGIESGDVLLRINDRVVEDIFDYRFLIRNEKLQVLIRKKPTQDFPEGEEWLLEIEKEEEDDLGLQFDNGLMDDYRTCTNQCVFCFIDQMPKGMRDTLYFKDDDTRLSFLQGNYATFTNMSDHD
ncbi:MAG: radical SAM protein, partial [Lachnospiraceae bacterium]|nr:radical SAM protein [Lachnospiraceae bacterium]